MEFTDLETWRRHCETLSTDDGADEGVLASDWAGAGITPPPARGPRNARVPLERATELREAARALEGEQRASTLREALDWLDCPHPRTPPELSAAMRRQRASIAAALGD